MSDARKIIGEYSGLSISSASDKVTIVITITASSAGDVIAALGTPEVGRHIELCLLAPAIKIKEPLLVSTQCAMRCRSPDFQKWIASTKLKKALLPEHRREAVVDYIRGACGINSRKELDTCEVAAEIWHAIEHEYSRYNQNYLLQRKKNENPTA